MEKRLKDIIKVELIKQDITGERYIEAVLPTSFTTIHVDEALTNKEAMFVHEDSARIKLLSSIHEAELKVFQDQVWDALAEAKKGTYNPESLVPLEQALQLICHMLKGTR